MRLIRNEKQHGKYALIELEKDGRVEFGPVGSENEFFVIKLKDANAHGALEGYLKTMKGKEGYDVDYAADIEVLASRAGPLSPWCKEPD